MSAALETHIAERNAAMQAKYDDAPDKTQVIDPAHYLEVVLADRAERYAAHMAAMEPSPEITQWSLAMGAKYGAKIRQPDGSVKVYRQPYIKAWHFIADWPTALLILVDGEECDPARSEPKTDGIWDEEAGEWIRKPSPGGWPMQWEERHFARAAQLLAGEKWPADRFTLLPMEG